ncbi:MAG: diguanylate cyclase [Clostridiales bacterium]|nr:diguanylate cyclase [Clostridiales bacterium]
MNQFIFLFLILTSFITLSIGGYAFFRKHESSALPFAALMFAVSIHAFGYALEHIVINQDVMLYLLKFEYIGIAFFPLLIVWFTIAIKNEEKRQDSLLLIVFFAFSLTTFFLVQTNDFHHLYFNEVNILFGEKRLYLELIRGSWFYVQAVVLICALVFMLQNSLKMYRKSTGYYKVKAKSILIAICFPIVIGVVLTLEVLPSPVDFFPMTYASIGIIWFLDFQKHGIFQMMPVTYKKIFEEVSEGVVVVDKDNLIVNYNLAAFDVFKEEVKLMNGLNIKPILEKLSFIENDDYIGKVFEVRYRNRFKIYQLKNTDMYDPKQAYQGKIIVINDITKEIDAGRVLKTLATQDSLTGISNRRHFFDRCKEKIEQARIEHKSVSCVLMDIDHFKLVNDTHGHLVGDNILKEVSHICYETLRPYDLMGRYGGEEFAILLYDTSLTDSHQIIERMRSEISAHHFFNDEGEVINITVSFGIHQPNLLVEDDMSIILRKADKSLYQAKNEGRDRIIFYSEQSV